MSLKKTNERSDPDLVRAAVAGDEEAFAELKLRHEVRIRKLLLGRLYRKGCSSPEDHIPPLEQDVWFQIWKKLFQVDVDFIGWSAIVSLNEANHHLDKCHKDKRHLSQFEEEPGGVLPQRLFVDFGRAYEARILLDRALLEAYRISQRFGQVLEMRVALGMEFDEIAQAIDLKKAAIRAIYYRGLRELKLRPGFNGSDLS
ncbi:MAG TPA: hypothetical protein VE842_14630 [Pyrinomonadaceae bacterium]|jgi:DNA-directed RNA polymerase specialized sigma24 family protein|nr:hypothetical protein [Pyrinomonadaceae bacterium]